MEDNLHKPSQILHVDQLLYRWQSNILNIKIPGKMKSTFIILILQIRNISSLCLLKTWLLLFARNKNSVLSCSKYRNNTVRIQEKREASSGVTEAGVGADEQEQTSHSSSQCQKWPKKGLNYFLLSETKVRESKCPPVQSKLYSQRFELHCNRNYLNKWGKSQYKSQWQHFKSDLTCHLKILCNFPVF